MIGWFQNRSRRRGRGLFIFLIAENQVGATTPSPILATGAPWLHVVRKMKESSCPSEMSLHFLCT
jgi:hypothetical protein